MTMDPRAAITGQGSRAPISTSLLSAAQLAVRQERGKMRRTIRSSRTIEFQVRTHHRNIWPVKITPFP